MERNQNVGRVGNLDGGICYSILAYVLPIALMRLNPIHALARKIAKRPAETYPRELLSGTFTDSTVTAAGKLLPLPKEPKSNW